MGSSACDSDWRRAGRPRPRRLRAPSPAAAQRTNWTRRTGFIRPARCWTRTISLMPTPLGTRPAARCCSTSAPTGPRMTATRRSGFWFFRATAGPQCPQPHIIRTPRPGSLATDLGSVFVTRSRGRVSSAPGRETGLILALEGIHARQSVEGTCISRRRGTPSLCFSASTCALAVLGEMSSRSPISSSVKPSARSERTCF